MIDERTGEKRFRSFAKEVRAYVGDGGGDIGREMGGGEKYFRTRRKQRKRAITEKTTGTSHISGQPARTGAHWRPMVAEEETQPRPGACYAGNHPRGRAHVESVFRDFLLFSEAIPLRSYFHHGRRW